MALEGGRQVRTAIALLFVLGASAVAQDMPLSQILPDGGTWRKSDAPTRTSAAGNYSTVKGEKAVHLKTDSGTKKFAVPLAEPSGLALWDGGGTLVVADAGGKHLWAFRVAADGSVADGDKYYALRVRKGVERSEAGGMAIDPLGRLYAATSEGVQVFDPTGRLCGVLLSPDRRPPTNVVLDGSTLYAMCGGTWYARELKPDGLRPPTPKK